MPETAFDKRESWISLGLSSPHKSSQVRATWRRSAGLGHEQMEMAGARKYTLRIGVWAASVISDGGPS